jgi:hypothetical protein
MDANEGVKAIPKGFNEKVYRLPEDTF